MCSRDLLNMERSRFYWKYNWQYNTCVIIVESGWVNDEPGDEKDILYVIWITLSL